MYANLNYLEHIFSMENAFPIALSNWNFCEISTHQNNLAFFDKYRLESMLNTIPSQLLIIKNSSDFLLYLLKTLFQTINPFKLPNQEIETYF